MTAHRHREAGRGGSADLSGIDGESWISIATRGWEWSEHFAEHVNQVAAPSLLMRGNSWYLGANVPGKPRVFMPYAGGLGRYRQKSSDVAATGYEGFIQD
jgi:hypothetical protein